jgi:hypothetical protein
LNKAIDAGKNKPIVVCGKKCRAKAGVNAKIPANISDDKMNFGGFDDAGEAMIIAAGIGVIGTLVGVVGSGVNNIYSTDKFNITFSSMISPTKFYDYDVNDDRAFSLEDENEFFLDLFYIYFVC